MAGLRTRKLFAKGSMPRRPINRHSRLETEDLMIDDFTSKHVLKFLEPLQAHIKELETKLGACEQRLVEERSALMDQISDQRKAIENREARLKAAESRLGAVRQLLGEWHNGMLDPDAACAEIDRATAVDLRRTEE
jgi:DNA repair exonuclease SbcCD ATPase subunit